MTAALGVDLETVTLTTTAMTGGVSYILSVSNVKDRATTPNTIAAGAQGAFTFVEIEGSLVGYWKFDEGSGTTAGNSGGGGDGTLVDMGASAWVPGVSGGVLDFDGSGSHVVVSNTAEFEIEGSEITLAAWIMPRDLGDVSGSRIISKRTDGGGRDVWALMTRSGNVQFRLDDGTDNNKDLTSSNIFQVNEWLHVTAVYDGTNKLLYINGLLDVSDSKSDTIDASSRAVHLGMRESDDRWFNGVMDEVRIYSRALNGTEIANLAGVEPPPPTLPGMTSPVQDLDGDGLAEDINGNGRLDFADLVVLFDNLDLRSSGALKLSVLRQH